MLTHGFLLAQRTRVVMRTAGAPGDI